jgi:adenosylcobinamide kinase / adenosylcobinamide-phosphate guanylyltransferase
LAQRLATEREPVMYVATAVVDPKDGEMLARVAHHRLQRPGGWSTLEVPRDLEGALGELVAQEGSIVIDCATLWISNLMLGLGGGPAWDDEAILVALDRTLDASRGKAQVIWVSNEVGSGGISPNALARRFADLQGRVNQRLATAAEAVHLCVAGLSLRLK